jgi:hypothetical protein
MLPVDWVLMCRSFSRDPPQRKLEPIRVDTYKHQRIIKTVLNDAASSPQPPFSLLGINHDDWAEWDKLYSRSGSGPGQAVHTTICMSSFMYVKRN